MSQINFIKALELTFDQSLISVARIKELVTKCYLSMNFLKYLAHPYARCSRKLFIRLYKSLVWSDGLWTFQAIKPKTPGSHSVFNTALQFPNQLLGSPSSLQKSHPNTFIDSLRQNIKLQTLVSIFTITSLLKLNYIHQ